MATTVAAADVDDRLPLAAIERIRALVELMPDEFELGAQQISQKSITTTLRFPAVGIHGQMEAMETILRASTVTPTLYRNLIEARRLLHSVLEEGDPGADLVEDIHRYLMIDCVR